MKVRDHHEVALVAVDHVRRVHPALGLVDVGPDIPVREHRALRRPRRAARVLEYREIIRRDRHLVSWCRTANEIGEAECAGDSGCRRGRG